MSDVNHPKHYNQGKIEVIEFIEDKKLGFNRGNAVKYIARAGIKDPAKEIEDLEKARWYVNRELELLRAVSEKREAVRPNTMAPQDSTTKEHLPQKDFKFPGRTAQEIQIEKDGCTSLAIENQKLRQAVYDFLDTAVYEACNLKSLVLNLRDAIK